MQKRALSLCHLLPLVPQLYEKIVAPSWHILSPDSPSCGASPPARGWMDSRVQLAHEFVMEKTNVLDCNQSSLHLIINLKPISKCLQIFYSFFRPESWLSVNYNSKITPITTKGTALFSKGAPKTIHFKYTWMEYIISCVNIRAELFFFPWKIWTCLGNDDGRADRKQSIHDKQEMKHTEAYIFKTAVLNNDQTISISMSV